MWLLSVEEGLVVAGVRAGGFCFLPHCGKDKKKKIFLLWVDGALVGYGCLMVSGLGCVCQGIIKLEQLAMQLRVFSFYHTCSTCFYTFVALGNYYFSIQKYGVWSGGGTQ